MATAARLVLFFGLMAFTTVVSGLFGRPSHDPTPVNAPPIYPQDHPGPHIQHGNLGHPQGHNILDFRLPHPHLPTFSPKTIAYVKKEFVKVKNCLKEELKKLPGGVTNALLLCLPTAPVGVPAFGACVAAKGTVSAAKATNHFAVCLG